MQTILNLNENNCADCYKCIRTCSVKAITFGGNNARILPDECVLCGSCYVVCPQKAKEVRNDLLVVKQAIKAGKKVVASIAPSFIADFRVSSVHEMEKALLSLGFSAVEETAIGAQIVSDEYAKIMEEKRQKVLITSCCPSINLLIQKYYPTMLPHLAKVLTPMQTHCKLIKEKDPNAFTVFIGPCIAKKSEADENLYTDVALTYDELREWFADESVEMSLQHVVKEEGVQARLYPATGGVLKATRRVEGYHRIAIDGIDNCRRVFEELDRGTIQNVIIEMSACEGSCVNGPSIREHHARRLKGALRVATYGGEKRFENIGTTAVGHAYGFLGTNQVKVGSEAIRDMLFQMGKTSPDKELNCGSCGYPTCREKAQAILEGKAHIEMCLPFLKQKAESFSDTIINNTPNAIMVLDEQLCVQQINRAAVQLFKLTDASDILTAPVGRLLNPEPYQTAVVSALRQSIHHRYLAEYHRYVEETILYDRQYHVIITVMRDVTESQALREQDQTLRRQTAEIADRVIEKQMRVVQEIASLLGETTAETKIALSKLKDAMDHE